VFERVQPTRTWPDQFGPDLSSAKENGQAERRSIRALTAYADRRLHALVEAKTTEGIGVDQLRRELVVAVIARLEEATRSCEDHAAP
jgi:hypothetical protein